MSSCADSCCTCCPAASSASATSASSRTDNEPRCCRSASVFSRLHSIHQSCDPKLSERRSCRSALSAVERCTSSNGSQPYSCLLALHPMQTGVPHEPATPTSNRPHALACIPGLCSQRLFPLELGSTGIRNHHSESHLAQRTRASPPASRRQPNNPTTPEATQPHSTPIDAPDIATSFKSLYLNRPQTAMHATTFRRGRSRYSTKT